MLKRLSQIACNACGADYPDEPSPQQPFEVRFEAERLGWRYDNGKDVCGPCVEGGAIPSHFMGRMGRPRKT